MGGEASSVIPVAARMERRTAAPSRFDFVDHAKAIGIVLVVWGHAPGTPSSLHTLIFSFHMPLFFFLSGFLLSQRKLEMKPGNYLSELARSLGRPYVVFFLMSFAYWLLTRNLGPRAEKFVDVTWYAPLKGFATGLGADLFVNPALWFFCSLLTTGLLYHLLRRYCSSPIATVLCTVAGVVNASLAHRFSVRLPWSLDIIGATLAFYAIGQWLRGVPTIWPTAVSRTTRGLVVILAATIWIALARACGNVDLNQAQFGNREWLFLPAALSGITTVLLIGSLLPPLAISEWLSRYTLIIFPTHALIFNMISGFFELFFQRPEGFSRTFGWSLLYLSIALLASIPITFIMGRLLPSIFPPQRPAAPARQLTDFTTAQE